MWVLTMEISLQTSQTNSCWDIMGPLNMILRKKTYAKEVHILGFSFVECLQCRFVVALDYQWKWGFSVNSSVETFRMVKMFYIWGDCGDTTFYSGITFKICKHTHTHKKTPHTQVNKFVVVNTIYKKRRFKIKGNILCV